MLISFIQEAEVLQHGRSNKPVLLVGAHCKQLTLSPAVAAMQKQHKEKHRCKNLPGGLQAMSCHFKVS